MIKSIALILFTLITFSQSEAALVKGKIKLFSGMEVETRTPYSYIAIETKGGQRILLPRWINATELLKVSQNIDVSTNADVDVVYCTDMSSACATGALSNIRTMKISFPAVTAKKMETYSGKVERFSGRGVERPIFYDYIAIEDAFKISVPTFLNEQSLLEDQATLTLVGKANSRFCTDMSAACGATVLSPLKSVSIQF